MSEEATLDAFVQDGDDEDDAAADADAGPTSDASVERDTAAETDRVSAESGTTTDGIQGEGVDPVSVTSSWVRDGGSCSACGEPAERLWQDGGQRVCATCKPWTRTGEDACDQ